MNTSNREYELGLVSVIIPTRGRTEVVERSIKSVCNQTYNKLEIILVNDNFAGDYCYEYINNIACVIRDNRLQTICCDAKGGAAARNLGIKCARGEFLTFLDDDDWIDSDKIEIQVKALSLLDDSYGAVTCLHRKYKCGKLIAVSTPFKDGKIWMQEIARTAMVTTNGPLMRRKAVDDAGYFDENLLRMQDVQFFTVFFYKYKVSLIRRYLYNIDTNDNQHHPDLSKLEKIKLDYLESIKPITDELTENAKAEIKAITMFDLGYSCFQSREWREGMVYIIEVLRYPRAFCYCTRRIIEKYKGKLFKLYYLHRYGKSSRE